MVPKTCSVDTCTLPHKARGMCGPHYAEWFRSTPKADRRQPARLDRFWAKVDKASDSSAGCWHWTGAMSDTGYGVFYDGNRKVKVHRFSYELANGDIPKGLVVDHTCHNETSCRDVPCAHRKCVNPHHLEAVTQSINSIRGRTGDHQSEKTHCPKGHEYSTENTIHSRRRRACRTCQRASNARYYQKRKAA